MAANPNTPREVVAGVVEATNPKGIKVGGRWWNWSQYGPALARPERGQHVRLEAKGGFIAALEPVGGALSTMVDARPVSTVVDAAPSKDATITRLAVLKAAAEFAAGRADLKSGDVLAIAERWEAWVAR